MNADLQMLVKQTSNSSIMKMQQRLHEEVVALGKIALDQKESLEALTLALETERDAANLYAKQVAHWIGKHDAILEQQLATVPQEWNDKNVIAWCVARGIKSAQEVKQCLNCLHYNEPMRQTMRHAPFGSSWYPHWLPSRYTPSGRVDENRYDRPMPRLRSSSQYIAQTVLPRLA